MHRDKLEVMTEDVDNKENIHPNISDDKKEVKVIMIDSEENEAVEKENEKRTGTKPKRPILIECVKKNVNYKL